MSAGRESGYSMIAAIVGVAAFGLVAFELLAQNRGVLAEVRGEAEQARLLAACNAGLNEAIAGLANRDVTQQWGIDGRPRVVQFGPIVLTITVEDERGKIPINGIIEQEIRQLFMRAGVSGARFDTLVGAYEDWEDPDNTPRPNGAEAPAYAPLGYKPRNGEFHTVGELRMLKGMDDALYAVIAPSVTVNFGESGGFTESTAQILALEVLGEVGPNSRQVMLRRLELSGERPVQEDAQKLNLVGRTLTVRVEAREGTTYFKRSGIFELTGNPADPYWLRYLD
jgi:general secretion pathway protein K